MRYLLVLIIAFFCLLSCPLSIAGTIDPDTPDEKYVEFGNQFPFVLKLCGKYADGGLFCASCVVIDPHWILTAAHVVNGYSICYVHKNEEIVFIDKIIIHDSYEVSSFGRDDIALGYLKKDIKLEFYPSLYNENDEEGKTCTISGFGLTGTFNTGIKFSDNRRRAGSNIVDKIDRNLLVCTPSYRKDKITALEFLIGSGDSGGGLFIGNKLAGINSCIMSEDKKTDSSYSDESGHTRISVYTDWIKSNMIVEK
jgi:hypothetical protein